MKKQLLALTLALFSISFLCGQVGEGQLDELDLYIEKARLQWQVPGLAIAVVKDGKVVFAKGYGVRELGKKDKVDSRTIFAICSTTKAMTAAAIGMLVDEGKIKWDDKVAGLLPDFQLYDSYVTRELRVRDLLTHNAGLGNADFLWFDNDLKGEEILHRMRLAKPAYSLRSGFIYQNIMYLAAGTLIAKVSGMPWETFIQKRILEPLGMDHSFPTKHHSLKENNRSVPHHYVYGDITPIEDSDADVIAPAGAVWSCVGDMAKWMNFMLDSAKVNGVPLLKPKTYAELLKPQVIIPPNRFYPTIALTKPHWLTYGLGWFQHDYKGRFVSFHTGSLPGTIAIIGLIPEEELGVYILGNLDHAEVRHALMYKVFDLFGEKDISRDWSSEMLELYVGIKEKAKKGRKEQEDKRIMGTRPGFPLEQYQGRYSDPFYGKADVTFVNGKLMVTLSTKLSLSLSHWHYDTFKGQWNRPWMNDTLVSFQPDINGQVSALKIVNRTFRK